MSTYLCLPQGQLSFYDLIDCGNFKKLERFGNYILSRPEPQAVWLPSLSEGEWQQKQHAEFKKTKGSEDRGEWINHKKIPDKWLVDFKEENLKLKISLSSFKHVGVFPEQNANWQYMANCLKKIKFEKPKVLNLFAYTGVASLVAKNHGSEVCHVDAIKQTVGWARESMDASGLTDIRWIVDDALKFVKREVRRGAIYQGIILDPPAYGRGPNGEKWHLEEGILELVSETLKLLDPQHHFYILNLYSMGFSALIPQTIVHSLNFNAKNEELGDLYIEDNFQKKLPLGVFYRFASH